MKPKLLLASVFALLALISPSIASAQQNFVSVVIPVRELSPLSTQGTLDLPKSLLSTVQQANQPITWLLDDAALSSATTSAFFRDVVGDPTQEIGLLLEVTPKLYSESSVAWPLHGTTSYLLNSFHSLSRETLIDNMIDHFHQAFGFYPHTVASTYIDSYSLSYLQEKYSITAAIFLDSTTRGVGPELTGFENFPYYPTINNALVPASNSKEKINLVISHLSPPNRNQESPPNFFPSSQQNLLNNFTHTNIGLGNHLPVEETLPIIKSILDSLTNNTSLAPVTPSQFSSWFTTYFPLTTPTYATKDTHSNGDIFFHYASPNYQLSLTQEGSKTFINDLIFFNHQESEPFRFDRNINPFISLSTYPIVDSNNPLSFDLNLNSTLLRTDKWTVNLDGVGNSNLYLSPEAIETNIDPKLPLHPQYSLSQNASQFIITPNRDWTPFRTPTLNRVLDLTKFSLVLLVILQLFSVSPKKLLALTRKHSVTSSIIVIGSALWSITAIKSGSLTPYGLGFWGAHGHDATFHLSLIESFKTSFWPLNNPNLAGTAIQNYHFLYDYLIAILSSTLNIPAVDLFFRLLPPAMALSIGILSYYLLRLWKYSPSSANTSLIFLYLTGSLGFIPNFIQKNTFLGGESIFWMQQNISTLINPPLALSLIFLLGFLILFQKWQNSLTPVRIFSLSLIAALLIQTKAYSSVLLLTSLGIIFITKFFVNKKKSFPLFYLILSIAALTIIFFLPSYSQSSSLFQFKPFWFIHSMLSAQDRLNWESASNAWQAYQANGQILKLLTLQLIATAIFFIGNLGIRIIALPRWWNQFSQSTTQRLVSWIILIGLFLPLIFIQSGNSWNSIQFSYYSLFFLTLLLGPTVNKLLSGSHTLPRFLVVLALIIIFTFPTTAATLAEYSSPTPSTAVTHEELRALDILSRLDPGVVITPAYTDKHHPYSNPIPVFALDSTAYIPALSTQPSFFADEVNLIIMNYNFASAKKLNHRVYSTKDSQFITDFTNQKQIKYIYQSPQNYLDIPDSEQYFTLIFDSGNYSIYTLK